MRSAATALIVAVLAAATLIAQQPAMHQLTGGGSVSVRRDGDRLLLTISGPGAGLASLCIGDESRVRILHASAAVGEAVYQKSGEQWTLASGFQFALRDARSGPPPESARRAFFEDRGWVANSDNSGKSAREFEIRIDPGARYLGVTFYTTSGTEAVSYWPATMSDDCRAVKVAQGFLPEAAQFRPASWFPVR